MAPQRVLVYRPTTMTFNGAEDALVRDFILSVPSNVDAESPLRARDLLLGYLHVQAGRCFNTERYTAHAEVAAPRPGLGNAALRCCVQPRTHSGSSPWPITLELEIHVLSLPEWTRLDPSLPGVVTTDALGLPK